MQDWSESIFGLSRISQCLLWQADFVEGLVFGNHQAWFDSTRLSSVEYVIAVGADRRRVSDLKIKKLCK